MKKNDLYKGFKVKEVVDIEDCASKGIFLVHERTGMEVFHLLNDDSENLFSFGFRTPNDNSTGVAHIIEHSVLCGSKKYPLKDPFLRLANQSMNTYLNALTASDRTMYPASSTVKSDYFNLMSVYADAVFFPLLTKETFLQEGYRVELDEKGNPQIQGVVYNEMKGVYSSFDGIADDEILKVIHEGTFYAKDSGGDPMEIPDLTYEQFKAFHKKYYCAANCMLFLYGNIPTEEQLDFIDKNVLSQIKNGGKKAAFPKPVAVETKKYVKAYGPDDSDENSSSDNTEKNVAVVAWKMNPCVKKGEFAKQAMELMFTSDLLFGDDCAPVSKVLLESKLGKDLSMQNGHNLTSSFYSLTFGLNGVEEKKSKEVEKLIFKTLEDLCKTGIDEKDLKRTCMDFEFLNREIVRFNSPYSLVLMRKVYACWNYNEKPWDKIKFRSRFEDFKKKILSEPEYLTSIIRKYYIENKEHTLVFVSPSKKWSEKRNALEKHNAKRLLASKGREQIEKELELMKKSQNADESELAHLIPHVNMKDVEYKPEDIKLKKCMFDGVPYGVCTQPTNGISYFEIAYPVDVLSPKDYIYLNLLAAVVHEMGWGDMKWTETLALTQSKCGNLSASVKPAFPDYEPLRKQVAENPLTKGRDILSFSMKCLSEDTEDALKILSDCIYKTDFKDSERLTVLLNSMVSYMSSYITSSAHRFAAMRSACLLNRHCAVREVFDGLSSYCYLKEFQKMDVKKLGKKLNSLLKKIRESGAMIYLVADEDGINAAENPVGNFIKENKLRLPDPKIEAEDKSFYALTEICYKKSKKSVNPVEVIKSVAKKTELDADEVFIIPGTVGYACSSISAVADMSKISVAQEVLSHCLSTNELWNKIRMEGGAYGVHLNTARMNGIASFVTYRDPKPFDSIRMFNESIQNLKDKKFDEVTVEKAVSGLFSDEIVPQVPSQKGYTAISRDLSGYSISIRKQYLKYLQAIKAKDINQAAKSFVEAEQTGKTVVVCSKNLIDSKKLKKYGKIISLPL